MGSGAFVALVRALSYVHVFGNDLASNGSLPEHVFRPIQCVVFNHFLIAVSSRTPELPFKVASWNQTVK